jgi:uncharacterized protein YlxW (UPF0749 family)
MLDDHTIEPDLKSKNMAELHRERMKSRPDEYTIAWWEKKLDEVTRGYLGACHAMNLTLAICRELREKDQQRAEEFQKVLAALKDAQAKVGELQGENELLAKRINDMGEWAKGIQKQVPQKTDG